MDRRPQVFVSDGRGVAGDARSGAARLLDMLEELRLHDHLCFIYETREDQFAAAIPAIRIGIARRERCVYVADENTTREVIDALRDGGIDVGAALESGILTVATRQETTLKEGHLVPETLLRFWAEAAEGATAAGFSGLRIVAEMTWALHGDPGTERLIEFEAKVNDLVRSHPIVGICQYNRRRFAPEVILNVIRVHPLVSFEGLVCRNPYYIPPQEFLAPHRAEKEVERLLTNLREREQTENALRASEERFRRYFELGLIGMAITSPTKGWVEVNEEICRILGYERSELLRMTWAELTHPDDLAADVAQFNRILAGEIDGYSMDKRYIRKDGEVIDATISGKCLRRAEGSVDYFVALVQDITERKRAEERLRTLSHRLLQAENEERRRIAQELHDSTAQDLVAVMMNLSLLQEALGERDKKAGEIIADTLAILENSASDIRTLSYVVHPPRLDETGLVGALTEYAAGFGRRAGIRVQVELPPDLDRLPEEIELALFRVVQESLANVLRHSKSDTAMIRLTKKEDSIVLDVIDHGRGLPPAMTPQSPGALGVGIAGMRERMQYFGGRLELESSTHGTTVRAVLSLPEKTK